MEREFIALGDVRVEPGASKVVRLPSRSLTKPCAPQPRYSPPITPASLMLAGKVLTPAHGPLKMVIFPSRSVTKAYTMDKWRSWTSVYFTIRLMTAGQFGYVLV